MCILGFFSFWMLLCGHFVLCNITNVYDWVRRDEYYYYFTEQKIANGAATFCDNYGAKQLSITSAQEQTFIDKQITKSNDSFWLGLVIAANNNCYDCKNGDSSACDACRNKWYWLDNSTSAYKHWADKQPQGGNHFCSRLQKNGKWKGAPCQGGNGYRNICKRKNQCDGTHCVRGKCEMVLTAEKYKCNCPEGYQGKDCSQDINECASNPCRHGGTCQDKIASYECKCPITWTGPRCKIDVDECENIADVCKNGGTCENKNGGYACHCADGYEGTNCKTDIDECDSNPCTNDGSCVDKVNMFQCSCTAYWAGKTCESDVNECSDDNEPEYCVHGVCTNYDGSYNCSCEEGYEGVNCAIAINATDADSNGGDDNLQVLWVVFAIAASMFAISFIVMLVMGYLDCRDERRLKQERAIRENRAKFDTKESNSLRDQQPSTSGASANVW